ncbi:MAG: ATP-binding protein [Candidatus Competibacteraceae bacterium]
MLLNACKFTEAGGHIELDVTDRDSEIVIAVADNGIGLRESDLERFSSHSRRPIRIFRQGDWALVWQCWSSN